MIFPQKRTFSAAALEDNNQGSKHLKCGEDVDKSLLLSARLLQRISKSQQYKSAVYLCELQKQRPTQVQKSERKEAERVYCGVQVRDVTTTKFFITIIVTK